MSCVWMKDNEGNICGRSAAHDVVANYTDRNGFAVEWSACEKHAREAKAMGFKVDGMEDADDDGM